MQASKDLKKILFISEALSAPFDEGIKNVAFSIQQQLEKKADLLSVTRKGNKTDNLKILQIGLNKLFLNNKLRKTVKSFSPNIIFYLPEASITFNSFMRAKSLKLMNRKSKVVILGVKSVYYSNSQRRLIVDFLRPDLLLLLGRFDDGFFQGKGLKVEVLPPAVDIFKFRPVSEGEKEKIRAELNIPVSKTVVSHVGHIRTTRNVESLIEVQKLDDVQVVVVGSTSTEKDNDVKDKLIKAGVRVLDYFIPDISKIYKMSDIYIFPVVDEIACIEMPLSVLEAMACNIPVITTKFGSLTDHFEEDAGFRYAETTEDMIRLIKAVKDREGINYHNSKKVEPFTWNKFADALLAACDN